VPDPSVLDASSVNKIHPGDAVDASWPKSLPPYLVSICSLVLGDSARKSAIIIEYLVKISKKARILELKQRYLKIAVLTTNTPYTSRKIRHICAYTSPKTTKETRFNTPMDDPNITMKEYFRLEEEKARKHRLSSLSLSKPLSLFLFLVLDSCYEDKVDAEAEQCHDIRPLPANLTDNMTLNLSNQLLESENGLVPQGQRRQLMTTQTPSPLPKTKLFLPAENQDSVKTRDGISLCSPLLEEILQSSRRSCLRTPTMIQAPHASFQEGAITIRTSSGTSKTMWPGVSNKTDSLVPGEIHEKWYVREAPGMIGDECNKGIMPTKIELTLEQSQQGVSNDILCMTRSSTNKLFTPYKEPKREFRSSRRHFKTLSLDELRSHDFNLLSDQEYSEEEVAETMAETMEQYMSKTRADY
ncbi:hypothetical protein Tco_1319918, partial [Tanacetum coccineum]